MLVTSKNIRIIKNRRRTGCQLHQENVSAPRTPTAPIYPVGYALTSIHHPRVNASPVHGPCAKPHISPTVNSIETHSPSSIELNRHQYQHHPRLLQRGAASSAHPSLQVTPCCRGRCANGRVAKAASSTIKQRKMMKEQPRT